MKGSPTHSPVGHHCDSPLHRAVPTTIGQANSHVDNTSPRTARTLPPAPVTSSQVSSDDSSPPVIPRRPTYPLSNKLKKSENSAFTPIGVSALNEDDLASTVTLTASQVSIPHVAPDPSSSPSAAVSLASGPSSLAQQASAAMHSTAQPPPQGAATTQSIATGTAGTLRHLALVDEHSSQHVQPVATIPSNTAASAAVANSGHVQNMSNHITSNLSDTHPNAFHGHSNNGAASQALLAQSGSESGSSGPQSEAHTLTRTHPDVVDELGEATSPSLNMEGGTTGWIDTVNQSLLTYTLPGTVLSQGSPQQLIHHTALVHHGMLPQATSYLHNQTSPTSVVTSSIVSSNISPSPTHSETSTQSGGMPYSPGLIYPSPYSPIPQMYPHISPLPSPLPLVKKPRGRPYGSNVSVNRMPTENDTLLSWLKSLRLHKYFPKFENTTFEEVCDCVCVCVYLIHNREHLQCRYTCTYISTNIHLHVCVCVFWYFHHVHVNLSRCAASQWR